MENDETVVTDVTTGEIMAAAGDMAFVRLQQAKTDVERYEAGQYAMQLLEVPGLERPIPRFMLDMPWDRDNDDTVEAILLNLATSADIEEATGERKLRKPEDVIGKAVVLLDVKMRRSDVQDAKWGAYAVLSLSVDGQPPEVMTSGHAQVLVTLWRCWCEGRFPVAGVFKLLGTPTKGRNQPVGFQVESKL